MIETFLKQLQTDEGDEDIRQTEGYGLIQALH